ncbi:MAG: transposase family protein, partial [Delftia sp.]|nr:transposase family protein [Delftia sp.]
TPEEFEMLLPFFKTAYDTYVAQIIEQTERKRAYGGGRKPALGGIENMLLFILFHKKVYPLQELIGFLFGMSQSQANEWIHKLTAVLKMALALLNHLPERDPRKPEKTLTEDGETDFAIDGTDRDIQRPNDNEKQKEFYSGEKKKHSDDEQEERELCVRDEVLFFQSAESCQCVSQPLPEVWPEASVFPT